MRGTESQRPDLSAYDLPYRLREEARESWDYAVCDEFIYALNPIKIAPNSDMGVAKGYRKGHIWIEAHLVLPGERDSHYAIIVEHYVATNGVRPINRSRRAVNRESGMLVDVAQLVQLPEEMATHIVGVPSVIRLKRFNDGECPCGYSLCHSTEYTGVRSLQNREVCVFGIRNAHFGKLPDKIIQRCAQAVDEIAGNESDLIWCIQNLHPNNVHMILKVVLTAESARFGFVESLQFTPKIFKMVFRPGCLEVGVGHASRIHSSQC